MANEYTAIDLSKLAPPAVVESLDFETILAEMVTALEAFKNEEGEPLFTALVESDPAFKILEVAAFREMLLRQRVNDAAKSVMLAYAVGPDLDHLGALYNVERLQISPGDPDAIPPIAAVMETNEDYRRRIQLAPEGFTVAGSEGSYVFHALSADPDVRDAIPTSPTPGDVTVTILSKSGDGTVSDTLRDTVAGYLTAAERRPLTDQVTVTKATIVNYTIEATLFFHSGLNQEATMAQAQTALNAYVAENHALGKDVAISGIYAALQQPGVQRVELSTPAVTISVEDDEAAFCTGTTLHDGGLA